MTNRSFDDLIVEIDERMSALGLHIAGPPSLMGSVDDEFASEETEEDDVGIVMPTEQDLADKLRADEASAVIHMTFQVNKLAWEDSTLYPDKKVLAEEFSALTQDIDDRQALRDVIAERIAAGEDVVDMLDLFLDDDEGET